MQDLQAEELVFTTKMKALSIVCSQEPKDADVVPIIAGRCENTLHNSVTLIKGIGESIYITDNYLVL